MKNAIVYINLEDLTILSLDFKERGVPTTIDDLILTQSFTTDDEQLIRAIYVEGMTIQEAFSPKRLLSIQLGTRDLSHEALRIVQSLS